MKKEEWIAYLIVWTVLLGLGVLFFYTVGFGWIHRISADVQAVHIEDDFLYEQLLQENEEQIQEKAAEESAAALENQSVTEQEIEEQEIMEQKKAVDQNVEEDVDLDLNKTREVLSGAVQKIQEAGNLISGYFIVDPNTTLTETDVPINELMNIDMKMQADESAPQILIYHTHATEGYVDSVDGDSTTTVVGVGNYLQELLTTRYGYNVLHVTEAYDLAQGYLDRSRAYNYARDDLEKILSEHPSIEVIIDLHRDGVGEEKHLVTEINGQPTAQIMFFNGLSRTNERGELTTLPNAYIRENLAFSLQLEVLGDYYYPDYVRSVYVKGYRYNLHFRPKSLLLEVGAQTNTLQEALNAMEPFAEILDKLLKGT